MFGLFRGRSKKNTIKLLLETFYGLNHLIAVNEGEKSINGSIDSYNQVISAEQQVREIIQKYEKADITDNDFDYVKKMNTSVRSYYEASLMSHIKSFEEIAKPLMGWDYKIDKFLSEMEWS